MASQNRLILKQRSAARYWVMDREGNAYGLIWEGLDSRQSVWLANRFGRYATREEGGRPSRNYCNDNRSARLVGPVAQKSSTPRCRCVNDDRMLC